MATTQTTKPIPLTISEIVSVVYCEQKTLLDIEHGHPEIRAVRLKREDGIAQHKHFENEGRRSQDQNCFIATAIYGPNAFETDFLRGWRDSVLLPTRLGRGFVRAYYFISPRMLPVLDRHPRLTSAARAALGRLVRFLEARSCR